MAAGAFEGALAVDEKSGAQDAAADAKKAPRDDTPKEAVRSRGACDSSGEQEAAWEGEEAAAAAAT